MYLLSPWLPMDLIINSQSFFFFFNLFFIFFADQSVFKEMFNFLYGFVADIQPLYSIGICIYLDQLSNQTALQCMKLLDLSRPPV